MCIPPPLQQKIKDIGKKFTAMDGRWIGMFCPRHKKNKDGGRADHDWFRITE